MEEEYERAKQKRKEKIMREEVKRGEKSVKKQNVLQLTSLTDETSEEKNSLFERKGSYLYLF